MATLQLQPAASGKRKQRKHLPAALRIDMTPMVDLGFLLITFFIVTTTMAGSGSTDLFMPKDGPPMDIKESAALTIIVADNEKVYMYTGRWEEALARQQVQEMHFSHMGFLRSWIQSKQAALGKQKDDLVVLIKATKDSRYQNLIDAIDEMIVHQVKRYAIVDLTPGETAYVEGAQEKRK